jgi:hypothetical protein
MALGLSSPPIALALWNYDSRRSTAGGNLVRDGAIVRVQVLADDGKRWSTCGVRLDARKGAHCWTCRWVAARPCRSACCASANPSPKSRQIERRQRLLWEP